MCLVFILYHQCDLPYSTGGIRTENSCWPPSPATLLSKIATCASWRMSSTRERTPARSTGVAPSFQPTRGPSGWNRTVPRTTVDGDEAIGKRSCYLQHARPLRTTLYLTSRVSQWRIEWIRNDESSRRLKLTHQGCTVETLALIYCFFDWLIYPYRQHLHLPF